MDIKEITPPPQPRTFSLSVTETEMDEIRIALTTLIDHQPQWHTDTQKYRVTVMRDKILQITWR